MPTEASVLGLATSAKDIVGTWVGIGNKYGLYQQWNKDGTCQSALTRELLTKQSDLKCIFRFEGTQLILTIESSPTGLPVCAAKTAIYEVQLLSDGRINLVAVQDPCTPRVNSTAQVHERVR